MQRITKWIRANREFILLSVFLFALGIELGFTSHSPALDHTIAAQMQKIKQIQQAYIQSGSHSWVLAYLVLKNNLIVMFSSVLLGSFLSVFPICSVLFNGVSIGYVLTHSPLTHGMAIWKLVLFGILPHGIFEIPALIMAAAMGIKLGSVWIRPIKGSSRRHSFRIVWNESLRVSPYVVLLLVVAAVVEGFVTPVLLHAAV